MLIARILCVDTVLSLTGGRFVSRSSCRLVLHAAAGSLADDPSGHHCGHFPQDQIPRTPFIVHDGRQ
jgi:hypothetical protein